MRSWVRGLVVGIVSVGLWPYLPPPVLVPLLFVLAAAGLAVRWTAGDFFSGLCFGMLLGLLHGYAFQSRRLPDECVGEQLSLKGEVVSLPRYSVMADGTPRQHFEFSVDSLAPARCHGPERLLISYYGAEVVSPGEAWHVVAKLKKPWGLSNPGAPNFQAWYAQAGIDAVGSISATGATRVASPATLDGLHHRLRLSISRQITTLDMDPRIRAVLRAVTVADKGGIDASFWSLLQSLGINHLMVISGLHIGLLAGLGFFAGRLLARVLPSDHPVVFAAPGVVAFAMAGAYTALAGFSLPTIRALCMLGCFIVADLGRRRGRASDSLLLAAAVVLVLNPLAGLGSGFWLSFVAVAALLWFGQWRRPSLTGRLIGAHVFMSLVMIPVGSWWFGGASVVSAPANFILMPLIGFAVIPPALLASLCHLLDWPLADPLWALAGWPLQQVLPFATALVTGGQAWMYQAIHAEAGTVALAAAGILLGVAPDGTRPQTGRGAVVFAPIVAL